MHWDTGNIAFMLVSTSLVMLMTPGLAFFYGGLVGRKNVLTIMLQSFVSMGVTTVLWVVCGYSMAFSGSYQSATNPDIGGIIGNFHLAFFRGIDPITPFPGSPTIPLIVFVAYQMMFAQITPALITGAFANRVTFKAYLLFLVAWLLLVYFPVAHMVWGGGILQANGVLDFAGGIVVHATAGFAALAAVFYVGKRRVPDAGLHSIPLVALGTGLLWFGWYGFNAGQRAQSRYRDVARVPQHRRRRLVCRDHVAGAGVDLREEAEVRRAAHRVDRRTRGRHAGGGICDARRPRS